MDTLDGKGFKPLSETEASIVRDADAPTSSRGSPSRFQPGRKRGLGLRRPVVRGQQSRRQTTSHVLEAGRPHALPLTTAHCTIVAADVAGFGEYDRNNTNQVRIRQGLYASVHLSFESSGIPWQLCRCGDRGDGLLILVPATVPKVLLADGLPLALLGALDKHNRSHPAVERIRLRLALHAGEVIFDEHGVTSSAINHTFRLLNAQSFRDVLGRSSAALAVISSSWFFEEVIRHSEGSHSAEYRQIEIANKETETLAWIRTLGVAPAGLSKRIRKRPVVGRSGKANRYR